MKEVVDVGLHSKEFRVISLFSGAGGLDLGLRLAVPETRIVCHVEQEAYACAVLAARMEEGRLHPAPIWSDVTTFDGKPWRGKVHCIAGGFPCVDVSLAGKQRGIEGPESGLWREFARIIGEVRPQFVYMENVANLLTSGFGRVLGDLANLGYNAEWCVQSAASVGAPHERRRVFILAYSNSNAIWQQPERDQREGGREGAPLRRNTKLRKPGKGPLGDTNCKGQLHGEGAGHYDGGWHRDAGIAMEHASLAGLQNGRQGLSHPGHPDFPPLFPSGPGDVDFWNRVLRERPDLAPAIESNVCRVDHELAAQLEFDNSIRGNRLRALGNGVVPLAAAVAFLHLSERMGLFWGWERTPSQGKQVAT